MTDKEKKHMYRIHHFRVGCFKCMAIDDGGLTYGPPKFSRPAEFLFATAPKDELDAALKAHGLARDTWESWPSPYTCLLIVTGTKRVLIDTGAGDFTPETGKLPGALESEGVAPADIDAVVITHGHCDHINGCAAEGREGMSPRFPNARYVVSEAEHKFWTTSRAEEVLDPHMAENLIPVARKNLAVIENRLDRITRATEVVPGVTARPAYGHTPGHLIVEVDGMALGGNGDVDASGRLVVLGDSIIHPLHCCYPHFSAAVDVSSEDATTTRRELLERLSGERCLVHGYHFPFPGVGHIVTVEQSYVFHPVTETQS